MNEEKKILVIDDEESIRLSMQAALGSEGYTVLLAENGRVGIKLVEREEPDLVFLDLRMPDLDGHAVLQAVKPLYEHITVVIITAYGDIKSAVRAVKEGAHDYINKPFELEEILLLAEKVFRSRSMRQAAELYQYQQQARFEQVRLLGRSPAMRKTLEEAKKIAATDATVLLQGETGTGKEMAARFLHQHSARVKKPFIEINCGALPASLAESELFGFEKSAFTGAAAMKRGLLELAHGGTVFLDEIGELSPEIQVKLLRFLENQNYKRIGGTRDIRVDVRIIAATNKVLRREVEAGRFRADLFFRLNVLPLTMPPLRERKEDVLLLAEYFLREYSRALGKGVKRIGPEACQALLRHSWPGNVRELKNLIERLVILGKVEQEEIHLEQLPQEFHVTAAPDLPGQAGTAAGGGGRHPERGPSPRRPQHGSCSPQAWPKRSLQEALDAVEIQYITRALEQTRWNILAAASILGLSRFALKRRIDKYFPASGSAHKERKRP